MKEEESENFENVLREEDKDSTMDKHSDLDENMFECRQDPIEEIRKAIRNGDTGKLGCHGVGPESETQKEVPNGCTFDSRENADLEDESKYDDFKDVFDTSFSAVYDFILGKE